MRGAILIAALLASPPALAVAGAANPDTPASAAAAAADRVPGSMPNPLGSGAVLEMILGLGAVIALILLLAWAARRVNVLPGQRAGMQVVAVLPLGQRERAVLVQVGERQLLLGVSQQQVTLLERFETPVVEPRRAPEGVFSRRLQEMIRQRGGQE